MTSRRTACHDLLRQGHIWPRQVLFGQSKAKPAESCLKQSLIVCSIVTHCAGSVTTLIKIKLVGIILREGLILEEKLFLNLIFIAPETKLRIVNAEH